MKVTQPQHKYIKYLLLFSLFVMLVLLLDESQTMIELRRVKRTKKKQMVRKEEKKKCRSFFLVFPPYTLHSVFYAITSMICLKMLTHWFSIWRLDVKKIHIVSVPINSILSLIFHSKKNGRPFCKIENQYTYTQSVPEKRKTLKNV